VKCIVYIPIIIATKNLEGESMSKEVKARVKIGRWVVDDIVFRKGDIVIAKIDGDDIEMTLTLGRSSYVVRPDRKEFYYFTESM
jgi:hypothetical protein